MERLREAREARLRDIFSPAQPDVTTSRCADEAGTQGGIKVWCCPEAHASAHRRMLEIKGFQGGVIPRPRSV